VANNKNYPEQWLPELKHNCPRTPVLLVGTKADLRNDIATIEQLRKSNMEVVSNQEAQELQKKSQLVFYSDCSALTRVSFCQKRNALFVLGAE